MPYHLFTYAFNYVCVYDRQTAFGGLAYHFYLVT